MYYLKTDEYFTKNGSYANLHYEQLRLFDSEDNLNKFIDKLQQSDAFKEKRTIILDSGEAHLSKMGQWVG